MMSTIFEPDVNYVPASNVYPRAAGRSLGAQSGAPGAQRFSGGGVVSNLAPADAAVTSGASIAGMSITGHPLAWWLAIAALFIGFVVIGRKTGEAGSFSNVRFNAYNITGITLASILGITLLKVVTTKWHIAGLSEVVGAA